MLLDDTPDVLEPNRVCPVPVDLVGALVFDGSFFLVPVESKVMKSADKVARKVKEANVTLEDLLQTLDEERRRYYKEHYVKN